MVSINKLFLTKNDCYKKGGKHKVQGIMVHSTGVNNPNLSRYVGPDDGKLGVNKYNNHWNQAKPDGQSKCVHAFIGKLKNGEVAIYQTLPWDMPGWHSGVGSKGSKYNANNTGYIGFEMCEDDLKNRDYFNKVYNKAVELCTYLCKQFNLTTDKIIGHYEGYKKGIASNHGDPDHWFKKFGKTMDTFRADVKKLLDKEKQTPTTTTNNKPQTTSSSTYKVVTNINGYKTAADAKSRKNKATTVKPGTYYIYKKADGTINVSTKPNTAGSWINPADNKVTTSTTSTTIKVGSIVKVKKGAKSYEGKNVSSFVYNKQYRVDALKNNRAVLDKKGICTAFNIKDLIFVQ